MVGGYRLRTLLATGQASQVWEVVEPNSGRHMAMKLLLPHAAKDPATKQMLVHEAEVGKALQHQNIIKIITTSKDPKQMFIVMEYFPAGSMKARIVQKQNDFIRDYSQLVFKQICTALAYMNSSGWVHRDVKPDNMLANSVGEAKLIDFALAERMKKGLFASLFGGNKKGKVQGTRSYISPEQIRNQKLDARADVYSFGASAYEIVTGRPPFRGATSQDLLSKHLNEKPMPPHTYNADVTDDFSKLVIDMLAKKREQRPANFHEVLMRLKTMRVFKNQAVLKTNRP
jgi:serine/threonine-protein kinase